MRLVVDAEGQVEVLAVVACRALRRLALFARLAIATFALLDPANPGATAEHLALLIEGLAGGKDPHRLLLGHILDLVRRCADLGRGRIRKRAL